MMSESLTRSLMVELIAKLEQGILKLLMSRYEDCLYPNMEICEFSPNLNGKCQTPTLDEPVIN
jgi:hypothetical protein